MNSGIVNASLQTVATGLIVLGAAMIKDNLVAGVIEICLGAIVYLIYEKFPPVTS